MPTTPDLVSSRREARRAQKPTEITEFSLTLTVGNVRRLLGMTQAQFAEILCVTGPYLSMIESGKRQPSAELYDRILSLLWAKASES